MHVGARAVRLRRDVSDGGDARANNGHHRRRSRRVPVGRKRVEMRLRRGTLLAPSAPQAVPPPPPLAGDRRRAERKPALANCTAAVAHPAIQA